MAETEASSTCRKAASGQPARKPHRCACPLKVSKEPSGARAGGRPASAQISVCSEISNASSTSMPR
jgi:hypothetical protein